MADKRGSWSLRSLYLIMHCSQKQMFSNYFSVTMRNILWLRFLWCFEFVTHFNKRLKQKLDVTFYLVVSTVFICTCPSVLKWYLLGNISHESITNLLWTEVTEKSELGNLKGMAEWYERWYVSFLERLGILKKLVSLCRISFIKVNNG